MFCNKCGKENPGASKFCPECGAPNDSVTQNQAPPKKTGAFKKILYGCAGLIIFLFIIGIAFGGNSSSKNSPTSSKQSDTATAKEPEYKFICDAEGVGKIKGTIASDVGVAIAGIEAVNSIDSPFSSTKAQGQFIIINLVATNNQKDEIKMDSNGFKLIDTQNREYSHSISGESSAIMNGEKSFFLEGINPGNTASGVVVFDVPKNATITKMQFKGGFSGKTGELPFKVMKAE